MATTRSQKAIQEFCSASLKLRDLVRVEKETRTPLNEGKTELKKRLYTELESNRTECVQLPAGAPFKFARLKKAYTLRTITPEILEQAVRRVTQEQLEPLVETKGAQSAVVEVTMDNVKTLRTTESTKAVLCNDKPRHLISIPQSSDEIRTIATDYYQIQQELKEISASQLEVKKVLKSTKDQASVEVVKYFQQQNASSQPLQLKYNGEECRYFLRKTKTSKKKSASVAEVKEMVQSAAQQIFDDDITVSETLSALPQFVDILLSKYNLHRTPKVTESVVLRRASEKKTENDSVVDSDIEE
jgi:hypothetical protein